MPERQHDVHSVHRSRYTARMTVVFSAHAIARYAERIRPGLTVEHAEVELKRLVVHGRIVKTPPEWFDNTEAAYDVRRLLHARDAWLLLGDTVVFPLTRVRGNWHAHTVIGRGTLSPEARARRNDRNRSKRYATQMRERTRNRGSRPDPSFDSPEAA